MEVPLPPVRPAHNSAVTSRTDIHEETVRIAHAQNVFCHIALVRNRDIPGIISFVFGHLLQAALTPRINAKRRTTLGEIGFFIECKATENYLDHLAARATG